MQFEGEETMTKQDDLLNENTRARVLERLGVSNPSRDLNGLERLYRAWCRGVPFDNVRKRLALREGTPEPLPGGTAEDFFASWLAHGTGGTCWPTSNALYVLLRDCGFAARRISACMRGTDVHNHGSIIVRLDGDDYLVDSSILCESVLPLRPAKRLELDDAVHPIVVEPVDGSFCIWWGFSMSTETLPCRLLSDPVDHRFYLERYEVSRQMSPFNDMLYARRNFDGRLISYVGNTRFEKTPAGVTARELGQAELAESLVAELGLSPAIVRELNA